MTFAENKKVIAMVLKWVLIRRSQCKTIGENNVLCFPIFQIILDLKFRGKIQDDHKNEIAVNERNNIYAIKLQ